jgi:hypothetical protein
MDPILKGHSDSLAITIEFPTGWPNGHIINVFCIGPRIDGPRSARNEIIDHLPESSSITRNKFVQCSFHLFEIFVDTPVIGRSRIFKIELYQIVRV